MKNIIAFAAICAAFAASAAPVVSNIEMQQLGETVHISYTLSGEPGIVTVDIQTNTSEDVWASIGGEHLTYFAGDANKRVEPGDHVITWKPRKAWPDNEVTENVKAVVSAWATNAPPDYMAVSLVVPGETRFYTSAGAVPFGVTNDLYKTEWLLMRKCPAANVTWRMGSPNTEVGYNDEVARLVTLDEDYYIGIYPFTQQQFYLIRKTRWGYFTADPDWKTRPVECVSYVNLRGTVADGGNWETNGHYVEPTSSFIGLLRNHSGLNGLDLPTEAQWEFACRAGCGAGLYNGQDLESEPSSERLNALGRYIYNGGYVGGVTEPEQMCTAEYGTAKVGSYAPNAWGIYDMLGNVWEWCLEWDATYPDVFRVIRGGCWNAGAKSCRCAGRSCYPPSAQDNITGFRLVCPAEIQ